MAGATRTFLKNWGVDLRLCSVAFPHSNCWAEIGVKTAKRLITDNTGPNCNLDTNELKRAMLQYRNCPDPTTMGYHQLYVFGRPIGYFIPIQPGRYQLYPNWVDTLIKLEEALRNRHICMCSREVDRTYQKTPSTQGR